MSNIAIVVIAEKRKLGQHFRIDRQVDRGAAAILVVASILRLDITAEILRWLFQDDVDRAPGRVPTEQRALRSTQNFDALDIEEPEIIGVLTRNIEIVDIGADRRVEGGDRFRIAQAAQEVGIRGADAGIVMSDQVRDIFGDIEGLMNFTDIKIVSGEGGNCDRHLLEHLLMPLRRHRDFFQSGRRCWRRHGLGVGGAHRHQRAATHHSCE